MKSLTRREFVRRTALAAAATQLLTSTRAAVAPAQPAEMPGLPAGEAPVRWLDGRTPVVQPGVTWGVAWPQGVHARATEFTLLGADGAAVPVQTWPTAFWPDGSLKWTAHAMPADATRSDSYVLKAGTPAAPARALQTAESDDGILINTGVIEASIARQGEVLVPRIRRGGDEVLVQGRLVMLQQDRPDRAAATELFGGRIDGVSLEQSGPIRAVVKIEGRHANESGAAWLPFVVRLYFYAGSDAVRMVHTIVHDGDEQKQFIRGLGMRFNVPMRGDQYDRHVRFAGQDAGLFAEAVQGLTGLRREPGAAVRQAQLAGAAVPARDTWNPAVVEGLPYIPTFGDWTLFQSSADGFEIRKRTREGFTWLGSAKGRRAGGMGYVGTPQGGVAFGIRNFWQSYPAQLDIRDATKDAAEVTLWLWAPQAGPMDLRPYHDGMGQDTYAKQVEGLEITYEDHEPGFDRPEGGGADQRALSVGPGPYSGPRDFGGHGRRGAQPAAAGHHAGASASLRCFRPALAAGGSLEPGPGGFGRPARLVFRFLRAATRAAPLVRLLGLWRCHAHL